MQEVEINHCSQMMCFSAKAQTAEISKFGNILASQKASLTISKIGAKENQVFICESFTFEINMPYVTCETRLAGRPQVMTWDPAVETMYFYDP